MDMLAAQRLPGSVMIPGLAMAEHAGVLAELMNEQVQVAVWDRDSPLDQQLIQRACQENMALKGWLEVADLRPSILRLLPSEAFSSLREDLNLLADMMACLFDVAGVGVRVTALEKPMCPRFHVDRIPVRLLCTYGGPGSQWLPAPSVPEGLLLPGEEQGGRYDDTQVQQLQAGQVALFKGETWQDNAGTGVVHRSPPLSPGQQRLLVTLDI